MTSSISCIFCSISRTCAGDRTTPSEGRSFMAAIRRSRSSTVATNSLCADKSCKLVALKAPAHGNTLRHASARRRASAIANSSSWLSSAVLGWLSSESYRMTRATDTTSTACVVVSSCIASRSSGVCASFRVTKLCAAAKLPLQSCCLTTSRVISETLRDGKSNPRALTRSFHICFHPPVLLKPRAAPLVSCCALACAATIPCRMLLESVGPIFPATT
mmetsp:Transcript_3650/g.13100  ORF Transcript_3650/g.13100 Transcript_3650/m.13100 type:complete len:218 (+) Transcript_3650:3963-4616(+)